jgi:hypothetical protein
VCLHAVLVARVCCHQRARFNPLMPPAGGLGSITRLSLRQDQQLRYGPSFKELHMELQPQTPQRLYVQIKPEGQDRWRVPDSIVSRCVAESSPCLPQQ